MSDRIPGSSYDNPIWYKKYKIYLSHIGIVENFEYEFVHDDYDGAEDANDHRYGYATSVDDAKAQIDELEADNFEPPTVNNEVI